MSLSFDPSTAYQASPETADQRTGHEPVLGGELREKAVWVDEAVCIGCRYCAHVACNTFAIEPTLGRSRALRQDGDSSACIQEAIDTCPVDCIHWVDFDDLARKPKVRDLVWSFVEEVNKELPAFEAVKKIGVLPAILTVEAGTLTPSLKVKRREVEDRYRELLEELYEGTIKRLDR